MFLDRNNIQIPADTENIAQAQDFISDFLKSHKTARKSVVSAVLLAEDILCCLIQNRQSDKDILTVKAAYTGGNTKITFESKGTPFTKEQLLHLISGECLTDEDEVYNEIVFARLRETAEKSIAVTNKSGRNLVVIQVQKSPYNTLYKSLLAIFGGIFCGMLIRLLLPDGIADFFASDVLASLSDVFLKALKMISLPFIFFSIITGIVGFKDVRALGKTSAQIFIGFMCTTLAAMFIAYGLFVVWPAGSTVLQKLIPSAAESVGEIENVSILETLKDIVPTNIITPFAESNALQVVFLAFLLGISMLLIGNKQPQLIQMAHSLNAWFLKACSLITYLTSFISFCSMTQLCIQIDLNSITYVLSWIRQIYAANVLQFLLYLVLVAVFARINPFTFTKQCFEIITTAFSTSSTNATLPTSIKDSREKLEIDPKIYSFSLPFGAAVHRDGTVITQMVSALFFARVFGIPVTGSLLLSLMITVFSLSMGEGALAGVSVLLIQLHIPSSALNLVMGLYGIACMIQTVNNVMGDVVVTTIVNSMKKIHKIQV